MGCAESRSCPENLEFGIPIDVPAKKGESQIYRSPFSTKELVTKVERYPDCDNISQIIQEALKRFSDKETFGKRLPGPNGTFGDYEWTTYTKIKNEIDLVGSALASNDLCVEDKQNNFRFVALWGVNRREWTITDLSCFLHGIIVIPVYDNLGPDAITHIFNLTSVKTLIVCKDKIPKLLRGVQDKRFTPLRTIISMDENIEPEYISLAKEVNINILTWTEFLKSGTKPASYVSRKLDDVAMFSYTSGTTGLLKAAMLTEQNILSFIQAMDMQPGLTPQEIGADDVHLSYLPLAHIFERFVYLLFFTRGVRIGFFRGDSLRIKEDLQVLRPTFFVGVPQVYHRFADLIKSSISRFTGAKKKLVDSAFEAKIENLQTKGSYTHAFYDKMVMNKMKEIIGGRVKIMITGSAPLPVEIGDLLKCAFCCPILEVYGASEGTVFTMCTPDNYLSGNVGGPFPNCEVKIKDFAELNYLCTDKDEFGRNTPRGEICVRGPSIFKGYYNDPEKTKEALDEDGWYSTGDIGVVLPNGTFKIIDRKKNLLRLSKGQEPYEKKY